MLRVSAVCDSGKRSPIVLWSVSPDVPTIQTKTDGAAHGGHAMRERGLHPQGPRTSWVGPTRCVCRALAGGRWPVRPEHAGNEFSNNRLGKA
jgi:hypothetical protein